ncbi:MAG: tRNA pseudouridine(54/55) synthase Pus10 [Promethearchaeota archaeon]
MHENIRNKKILDSVLEILNDYTLCPECLGRQFALLGTGLSNTQRAQSLLNVLVMKLHNTIKSSTPQTGKFEEENSADYACKEMKIIAENANYTPAKKILDKFGIVYKDYTDDHSQDSFICSLCNNIFSRLGEIVEKITEKTHGYEFTNFLIGTIMSPMVQDREDELRVRLKISTGEAFKRNLNRVVGIKIGNIWNKPVEFSDPEMNIYLKIGLNAQNFSVMIHPNSLCIRGRYHKYERGIPQTHWPHRACRGKGCKDCNYTGKQYPTSVEELLTPFIQKYVSGESSKFHGAGREDIDARCIGNGRPFIIEIKKPHLRNISLKKIEEEIKNKVGDRVDAVGLKVVSRLEIKNIKKKGEKTSKVYQLLVKSESKIQKDDFNNKIKIVHERLNGKMLYQRTPTRVVHRRADLTRERKIYEIEGAWRDPFHLVFKIKAMGGTYIKELISGDSGRTVPSISGIFGIHMECIELDVLEIQHF